VGFFLPDRYAKSGEYLTLLMHIKIADANCKMIEQKGLACKLSNGGAMKDVMTESIRCYIEPDGHLLALILGSKPQSLSRKVAHIISVTHNREPRAESYTIKFEKTNGQMEDVRLLISQASGDRMTG
jgi:hypothetical protein